MALLDEEPLAPVGRREAPHDLFAQTIEVDDGVDDELGREAQQVDVLLVLGPSLRDERRPLVVVRDRGDLVGVDTR